MADKPTDKPGEKPSEPTASTLPKKPEPPPNLIFKGGQSPPRPRGGTPREWRMIDEGKKE